MIRLRDGHTVTLSRGDAERLIDALRALETSGPVFLSDKPLPYAKTMARIEAAITFRDREVVDLAPGEDAAVLRALDVLDESSEGSLATLRHMLVRAGADA